MEWFIAVVVIATLGVAAMAAAGGMGEMSKEPVRDTYRQDLPVDRPLRAEDIQQLRFGITLRGYAMAQVDDLLDRLAADPAFAGIPAAALRAELDPAHYTGRAAQQVGEFLTEYLHPLLRRARPLAAETEAAEVRV